MGNLDGRRFQDIYVIDMATGERRLALKRARWYNGPSPDGKIVPLLRGRQLSRVARWTAGRRATSRWAWPRRSSTPKTTTTSSSRRPAPSAGRRTASRSCSATTGTSGRCRWPAAPASTSPSTAVRTRSAISAAIRTRAAEERDDGIDLSKPQYFAAYGEWTKKAGIARLDPGKPGMRDARLVRRRRSAG